MNDNAKNISKVINSKGFSRLLKYRNTVRFVLSGLTLLFHAFFVGGIAFYNDFFAKPLYAGSSIPLGIFFTVLVIVLFILLELIYTLISYSRLDSMQDEIKREVSKYV